MSSYPSFFITGTDTGVGKTRIACQILRQLREQGINAAGAKPIASGMEETNGQWLNEDIQAIQEATQRQFSLELVNQYRYESPVAPHIAAMDQGEEIDARAILDCFYRLVAQSDLVVVEGAGGLMTPLNGAQTLVDLIRLLNLPVVLVVAIRLGCINHALLSQRVLELAGIPLLAWVANYPAAGAARDIAVEESLVGRLQAPLLGVVPWSSESMNTTTLDLERLVATH